MINGALQSIVGDGASVQQISAHLTENVLGQVTGLLPIVIPVIIGFIAFRKGYKFLKGSLRSA